MNLRQDVYSIIQAKKRLQHEGIRGKNKDKDNKNNRRCKMR
jgi:hypothetical protein